MDSRMGRVAYGLGLQPLPDELRRNLALSKFLTRAVPPDLGALCPHPDGHENGHVHCIGSVKSSDGPSSASSGGADHVRVDPRIGHRVGPTSLGLNRALSLIHI